MILVLSLCLWSFDTKAQAIVSSAVSKGKREAIVKSAIIYQLTKYINWPQKKQPPLIMCAYATDRFIAELRNFFLKKSSETTLIVQDRNSNTNNCDIIYIQSGYIKNFWKTKNQYALFISDYASFIDIGGMVGLVERQGSINIELNLEILEKNNFLVSPDLIEIAVRVIK